MSRALGSVLCVGLRQAENISRRFSELLVWNTTKTFRNPCECSIGLINISIYYRKKIGVHFVQIIKKKFQIRNKINGPRLTARHFGVVKFAIGKIGDLNIKRRIKE